MLTNPDTLATVVRAEHALRVERADRRARLFWGDPPPRPASGAERGGTVHAMWTRLARAARGVRWVRRPAHA